jgi:hypothetical protein
MILTTIFYGRRFPDRAERQWFWPRFSTGVALKSYMCSKGLPRISKKRNKKKNI